MTVLSSEKISANVENIIHEDTQLHEMSIDLTVKSILHFDGAGALDFGGSEFEAAETSPIKPEKQNPEDDYGWWKLEGGIYKISFNESLSLGEGMLALITPHAHARDAGLLTNTTLSDSNETSSFIIHVPEVGCHIKENARLGTAFLFESA